MSSAKILISQNSIALTISFMYNKNKNGPKTLPCGTPEKTEAGFDRELLITTLNERSLRKDEIT